MEKLIAEVEAYSAALGRSPDWVLRAAINAGGGEWAKWVNGERSPTVARADRLRAYMAANPPKAEDAA